MSRKIPPCAWCGKPIGRDHTRITVLFEGLDGRPLVAWHGDCNDSLGPLGLIPRPSASQIVAKILLRDPKRVLFTNQKAKRKTK